MREWYSLVGVEQALAARDNACGPAPLDYFLKEFKAALSSDAPPYRQWRVPFYEPWEQNTGYEARVLLDGSDDPPVEVDPPTRRRQLFSEYVLGLAWWKLTDDCPKIVVYGRDLGHYAATLDPRRLDFFTSGFEELPREVDPAFNFYFQPLPEPFEQHTLRFFGPAGRVEVNAKGDPSTGPRPAYYVLAADTAEQLFDLYAVAWPCHGTLVRLNEVDPNSDPGIDEMMKKRFRERFPDVEVDQ